MVWVVGVTYNSEQVDPIGRNKKGDILDLGIKVEQVATMHVYFIHGNLSEGDIKKACVELLSDSQIQQYNYSKDGSSLELVKDRNAWVVQVRNKPGVTDAVGESTKKGMEIIGINGVEKVEAAFTYVIKGDVSEEKVRTICEKSLANSLIQDYEYVRV